MIGIFVYCCIKQKRTSKTTDDEILINQQSTKPTINKDSGKGNYKKNLAKKYDDEERVMSSLSTKQ